MSAAETLSPPMRPSGKQPTLPAGVLTPPPSGHVTEEAFEAWIRQQEKVRAEWVDGEVEIMSNASFEHNAIVLWLLRLLSEFVEKHDLGVMNFDNQMRLASQRRRRLPDAYFLRKDRRHLMGTATMEGPFDLAIEVVSPDEAEKDYVTKFREYEAAGVAEYWIVDPQNRHLSAWRLIDGRYEALERRDEKVFSTVLPGLWLRPADLFTDPRPSVTKLLGEIEAPTKA